LVVGTRGSTQLSHNLHLPIVVSRYPLGYRPRLAKSIALYATTIYHCAGTCGMGTASTGVVDARFRVHGIEGLWVCDAFAMPTLVSCNTQATVMMMAYRLAQWLGDTEN